MQIGIVTGRTVAVTREGDQPGRVLQCVLTDPTDVQTVETCQAGDEYNPPLGVRVLLERAGESHPLAVALDDGVAPVMLPGGRRLYATNDAGEAVVAELRLHPDGRAELFNGEVALTLHPDGRAVVANDNASFTMNADGTFEFHGTGSHFDHPVTMASTLGVTGAVSSDASVTAPTVSDAAGSMQEMRDIYNSHSPSAAQHPPTGAYRME